MQTISSKKLTTFDITLHDGTPKIGGSFMHVSRTLETQKEEVIGELEVPN